METNLLFDIGANRGDATSAGIDKGFKKIISIEPAPITFSTLVRTFIYTDSVIPLKLAVGSTNNELVEFYECVEDGLSTTEKAWLTDPSMPYNGKQFRTIAAITCTLDYLIDYYGVPDLVKIDVEGAESEVFAGLTKKPKNLAFEWTIETLDQHIEQLHRLKKVNGYKEYALQYITHHLDQPKEYRPLKDPEDLRSWIEETAELWVGGEWLRQGRLRPTADVGMIWVK
jgi:FkbM family methyltransferase